ncbi:MAG: ABC transporter substrate-binding protein [Actinomycetota bacterium]
MDRSEEFNIRLNRRRLLERGAMAGAGLIVVPSLLAACGGGSATTDGGATGAMSTAANTETTSGAPTAGGVFRAAVSDAGPTETLDPHAIASVVDQYRAFNLYDRLAETQIDGTVKPHLAESIAAADDTSTTWIVKLRSGVTFHDGSPLTAADVLWSFRRIGGDPEAPYFASVDPYIDVAKSSVKDDLTVEFVLKAPYGNFQWFLSQKPLFIVKDGTKDIADPASVVGTGPFKLESFEPGQKTVMTRYDGYFLAPEPYFDAVELIQIAKEQQKAALLAGQIDGTENFDVIAQALELEGNAAAALFRVPGANPPQFNMRMDVAPFDDPKVREAMKLSIDREQMMSLLFQDQATLANDLHGASFPSYNSDLPQRAYDPEKAKALLKEAGKEGLTVELVTGLYPDAAQAFAQQAKASGITINLKKIPQADVYNTDLYYLKVPFGETYWGNDSFEYIAPMAYFKDGPYNETRWNDPAWEKEFIAASAVADDAERNARYKELQVPLWENGGEIIFNWGDGLFAGKPTIQGVQPRIGFIWNDLRFREMWYQA